MDQVYADFVELTNALIVIGSAPELEQLAQYLNADAVDAKKEYDLLAMDGSTPVTPVEPEVTPVVEE